MVNVLVGYDRGISDCPRATGTEYTTEFLEEFKRVGSTIGYNVKLVGKWMQDRIDGKDLQNHAEHYFGGKVDWYFGPLAFLTPEQMSAWKHTEWNYDMHFQPHGWIAEGNKNTMFLMRSPKMRYYYDTQEDFGRGGQYLDEKDWVEHCNIRVVEEDWATKQIHVPTYFFPISADPSNYPQDFQREYDVSLIGVISKYYPLRYKIYYELPPLAGRRKINAFILSSPPTVYGHDTSIILNSPELRTQYRVGIDYCHHLCKSKIFIFDAGFAKYPVAKYIEGLMSGACVMADKPFHAEDLGLVDGETYVEINKDNWEEKFLYYHEHQDEARRIGRNGRLLAEKKHTHEVRARELIGYMEKCV